MNGPQNAAKNIMNKQEKLKYFYMGILISLLFLFIFYFLEMHLKTEHNLNNCYLFESPFFLWIILGFFFGSLLLIGFVHYCATLFDRHD